MATFNIFQNGTLADANQVNTNFNYITNQTLLEQINGSKTTGSSLHSALIYGGLYGTQSALTYVNTGSSTAYYDSTGTVAFCDQLDLFGDASINFNIWGSVISNAGGGFGCTANITEGSGVIHVDSNGGANATGTATARLTSNGTAAGSFDMKGSVTELIVSLNYQAQSLDSQNVQFGITDGTHDAAILNIGAPASAALTYRVLFNPTAGSVYYTTDPLNGTYSGLALTTLTGSARMIYFYTLVSGDGAHDTNLCHLAINGVGYRKHGAASGNAIFQTAGINLPGTSTVGISQLLLGSSLPATTVGSISLNNGVSYASNSFGSWVTPTTGSVFVGKFSVAKPTSVIAGSFNIPVATAWGAFIN